jgi:hypothetical protein
MVLRTNNGNFTRPYKFENGTLWVHFSEINYNLGFSHVE